MKPTGIRTRHDPASITQAATLFFQVRGLVRTKLAAGRRLDPYAWLRIETLKFIADAEGPSMKDIALHLAITAPSATSLVHALAKAGLIKKKTDARDKRALRVSLTLKGERLLKSTIKKGMGILGAVFAPLTPTELTAFSRALERVLAADTQG